MGGNMSRDKGQRAERAAIALLQPVVNEEYAKRGLDAPRLQRNTLQSDKGGYDISGLLWLGLEIKHQETLAIEKWWEQTVRQAKAGAEPVLMYKQNNIRFRARIMVHVPIFRSHQHLALVSDIDLESFLIYFRARLSAELDYAKVEEYAN